MAGAGVKDPGMLLNRINDEIKAGAGRTMAEMSDDLQTDIAGNVPSMIVARGLPAAHSYLLAKIGPSSQRFLKMPPE